VKGGIDSKIINNYLSADPSYYSNIAVGSGADGSRVFHSKNIEIADNILVGRQNVQVYEGSKNGISIHDNKASGQWSTNVGPDGHPNGVIFAASGGGTGSTSGGSTDSPSGGGTGSTSGGSTDSPSGGGTSTPGTDALQGTSANETLRGTAGSDEIYGVGGADKLYGEAGSDTIDGGSGNDRLMGGLGADVLSGSAGNDVFVFNTALSGGVDRITDFSGSDSFRLENSVFTALGAAGPLASSAFHSGSAAHDSSDRIIYNPATGALTYDADGTGSRAPAQFATLETGLSLSASDFTIW
jgi:Ca2+-binding RTX toxin-like protein